MGNTKEINMMLNFKQNTPENVIDWLKTTFNDTDHFLTNGYRHACGKPVLDFYMDEDRPEDYHNSDKTYYLRYSNTLKDYENAFEKWLESMTPYLVQVNGSHLGSVYESSSGKYSLICLTDEGIRYVQLDKKEALGVVWKYGKTYLCPPDCGGAEGDEYGHKPFCPKCGEELDVCPNPSYCKYCGQMLRWIDEPDKENRQNTEKVPNTEYPTRGSFVVVAVKDFANNFKVGAELPITVLPDGDWLVDGVAKISPEKVKPYVKMHR